MPIHDDRNASRWFERAMRCYIEKHQGCAWCGHSYCVFRSRRADGIEFSCSLCDFFACHHHQSNRYYAGPGQTPAVAEAEVAAVG